VPGTGTADAAAPVPALIRAQPWRPMLPLVLSGPLSTNPSWVLRGASHADPGVRGPLTRRIWRSNHTLLWLDIRQPSHSATSWPPKIPLANAPQMGRKRGPI